MGSFPAPSSCTAMRSPRTPRASRRSRTSLDEVGADHVTGSPRVDAAPVALAPRVYTSQLPSTVMSRSASPRPSAASIQPRVPRAVVSTAMSSGPYSARSVLAASSSSSASGWVWIVGA
jgi:hypothetical protein